ncbi:hypothetical protein EMCRGX_G016257 [Ephydatia muelleri]
MAFTEALVHERGGYAALGFARDSRQPFPNGKLSFVPEDYGKTLTPVKVKKAAQQPIPQPADLPSSMAKCEFCSVVGEKETFLAPSRRFCSLTCCKRYSAEKRYYPYGRDEQGIAQSVREGLLNSNRSTRVLRAGARQKARERHISRDGEEDVKGALEESTSSHRGRGRRPKRSRGRTPTSPVYDEEQDSVQEPYVHPNGTPIYEWTVDDVSNFLTALGYEAYIDRFVEHEVDGKALTLIKDHHLLMTLKLRLGPTLKICEHVNLLTLHNESSTEAVE